MLCKRHGSGVKPAVDNLRYTAHGLATVRADKGYFVNIRAVQLYFSRIRVSASLCQLCTAADGLLMSAAFTFPDI